MKRLIIQHLLKFVFGDDSQTILRIPNVKIENKDKKLWSDRNIQCKKGKLAWNELSMDADKQVSQSQKHLSSNQEITTTIN